MVISEYIAALVDDHPGAGPPLLLFILPSGSPEFLEEFLERGALEEVLTESPPWGEAHRPFAENAHHRRPHLIGNINKGSFQ